MFLSFTPEFGWRLTKFESLFQPFIRLGTLSPACFDELGYCLEIREGDLLAPGWLPGLHI